MEQKLEFLHFDDWIRYNYPEIDFDKYQNDYYLYDDDDTSYYWDEKEKISWLKSLKNELIDECQNILEFIQKYCFDCKYIVNNGVFEGVKILVDDEQGDEKGYILSKADEGYIYYEIDIIGKDYYSTSLPIDSNINKTIFEFFKFCYNNNVSCDFLSKL